MKRRPTVLNISTTCIPSPTPIQCHSDPRNWLFVRGLRRSPERFHLEFTRVQDGLVQAGRPQCLFIADRLCLRPLRDKNESHGRAATSPIHVTTSQVI